MMSESDPGHGQLIDSPGSVERAPVPGAGAVSPLRAPDGQMLTHMSYLTIDPESASVARARSFVRQLVSEWQLDGIHDEAALVVSELVTNAITATKASEAQRLMQNPRNN